MSERLAWSVDELATAYGVSTRTVRRLVASGALDAFKIGGATRITEESRRRWAETLPRVGAGAPVTQSQNQAAA